MVKGMETGILHGAKEYDAIPQIDILQIKRKVALESIDISDNGPNI